MDETLSTLSEVREKRGRGEGETGRERRKVSFSEGENKMPGDF